MKYFSLEGKTIDEITKKLIRDYDKKAFIIHLEKKSRQVESLEKKLWWQRKPHVQIQEETFFRAYCAISEQEDFASSPEEQPHSQELNTADAGMGKESYLNPDKLEEKEKSISSLSMPFSYEESHPREKHKGDLEEKYLFPTQESGIFLSNSLFRYMLEKGFSYPFIQNFLLSLQTPIADIDMLKIILKEKLRLAIRVEKGLHFQSGHVYVFVGSTGVGKTTTLAKVAAKAYQQGFQDMQFITFDDYRLGADIHLQKYATIFQKPFSFLKSKADWEQFIQQDLGRDILFIDTAGETLYQDAKALEVVELLRKWTRQMTVILVLSASMRGEALLQTLHKFKFIGIDGYIITKLDETTQPYAILENMYEESQPIFYVSQGQKVPEDLDEMDINLFFKF